MSTGEATREAPSMIGGNGALKGVLHWTVPWLPYVGFLCMVYSAIKAIVDTGGETGTVFFVASSFSLLAGLQLCTLAWGTKKDVGSVREEERKQRQHLGHAVLCVAAALAVLLFSREVATVLASFAVSAFVAFLALQLNYFLLLREHLALPALEHC